VCVYSLNGVLLFAFLSREVISVVRDLSVQLVSCLLVLRETVLFEQINEYVYK